MSNIRVIQLPLLCIFFGGNRGVDIIILKTSRFILQEISNKNSNFDRRYVP